ncbi:MAG TPA: glucosamine-6-phosphate deaminase [Candidatus Tectomicrobia bacterium]|nr:glucosamine-6-phosphate deaminase [Candidatus Tectomicrobia bacterium]
MRVIVAPDPDGLADLAADVVRARVRARPDLVMAVPAGRTPRRMYARLAERQAVDPVDLSRLRLFCVDELCPPAPPDGYFWRQIRKELLSWARVPLAQCHPFAVDAGDLAAMCAAYEARIAAVGGLDLVMLGLGPNGHIASNEPPADPASRTRPVRLLPGTVEYILTDDVIQGEVCDRAVTLGVATILAAREVVVLVSGPAKRDILERTLRGPVTADVPASLLRAHPACTILADREACRDDQALGSDAAALPAGGSAPGPGERGPDAG